jgi:hypothetical protein
MKEITDKNFGLIIAFLLPGFLLVWMLSLSDFGNAEVWLKSFGVPSVSGFLYVTLASLALGLIISAVRWVVIDQILGCYYFLRHQKHLPKIDFSKLSDPNKYAVFQGANENHYRYYQYYSNTLVAIVVGFSIYQFRSTKWAPALIWVIFGVLIVVLLLASKDCLFKYHERASEIANS